MEQRSKSNDAAIKNALIKLGKEQYVLGMGQRSNHYALTMDAIKPNAIECAFGMGLYDILIESDASLPLPHGSAFDDTIATLPNLSLSAQPQLR